MTIHKTNTSGTFSVTDSFDGRTIEDLTRISTTKLARKAAQKIANHHHDQVSLIRLDGRGQRHLVDLFEPQPAEPAGRGEGTPISRRSALIGACGAAVVAVMPAAPVEASEPLVALEAHLKEIRATGENAFEACQTAEDEAALMRAEIAWEAIQDRADVAEREVWDTPAKSPQGVLIKLRESHFQLAQIDETDDTLESNFAVGIVGDVLDDLERLISEAWS